MTRKFNNNYRVPGAKMTSRYGVSHAETRAHRKAENEFCKGHPDYKEGPAPIPRMNARARAKCEHKRMIGTGWGGPDSGGDGGYCPDCGYSWEVTFY